MPWLSHPRYIPARSRLIQYLRGTSYRFRKLAPVLFICGAYQSPVRDRLRDYLAAHQPDLMLFYAERVWELIAQHVAAGALKMEADLAALADMVIIVVESPGTFAELGAFSLSTDLRKKLLPIVEKKFEGAPSFLETGPLRWINQESLFSPTIYAPHSQILLAIGEISDRLKRIPPPATTRVKELGESLKLLVFFTCDLVSVIQPATVEIIDHYLHEIVPSLNVETGTIVGVAEAMGLLASYRTKLPTAEEITFFTRTQREQARPFHHKRLLDLPTQRLEHYSVLLKIPDARAIMNEMSLQC